MRLILLDSNSWLSHYNVQLLQIELQCGPLDSKSQRRLTHSYALFEDCFQCPSHVLHRIFTEHDVACKWSEQRIDSGICQISSFKLRGWGRLWHQRGFEWEGKGHVSLDQQIQLTQAPWKERNLLSEAAGLSIHVHHHLENYQFRPDVDITLNSEPWGIQPIQVNMWHDANVNYRGVSKTSSFPQNSSNTEHYFNLQNFGDSIQWYAQSTHTVLSSHGLYCQVKQISHKCQS